MDDIDRSLLEILQQNATLSIAQMAERVGLSPTPCWKRIQKLEATGVITRRVAVVDPDRVGVGLSVLVSSEAGEHTPEWLNASASGSAPCRKSWKPTEWRAMSTRCCVTVADMADTMPSTSA